MKKLRETINEAINDDIKPSKIKITEFLGDFNKKWARVTVSRWYSFYKLKEGISTIIDELKMNNSTHNKEKLAKMTLRELGIIADYLKIDIEGKKENRIELIINHINKS